MNWKKNNDNNDYIKNIYGIVRAKVPEVCHGNMTTFPYKQTNEALILDQMEIHNFGK